MSSLPPLVLHSFCSALLRGGLPGRDYSMMIGIFLATVLTLGLGALLFLYG